jgi:2'-5' RNA ligase
MVLVERRASRPSLHTVTSSLKRVIVRLFIALDIDDAIRERMAGFMDGLRGFAPDVRWVQTESLHVTLKFIGEKPTDFVTKVTDALSAIRVAPVEIVFRGYGFFPTAKSARVFWAGLHAGPELQKLAEAVDGVTASLGVQKEEHAFSPHLTLARKSGGSGTPRRQKGDGPNRVFQKLQEKLAALPEPEFGTMTAREFFLYQSQLSPKGSRYTKLQGFALPLEDATGETDARQNP